MVSSQGRPATTLVPGTRQQLALPSIATTTPTGESISSYLELAYTTQKIGRAARVLVLSGEGTVARKQGANQLLKETSHSLLHLRREVRSLTFVIIELEMCQVVHLLTTPPVAVPYRCEGALLDGRSTAGLPSFRGGPQTAQIQRIQVCKPTHVTYTTSYFHT